MSIQTTEEHSLKKLGDLFTLEYGTALTEKDRRGDAYPVYGSNGEVGRHENYFVEGPGVIVGRKGTIGAVSYTEENFWPIDTTYYVVPKQNNDIRWIYFLLQSIDLKRLNRASGTPGLNRDDVYALQALTPSPSEQQKIADILMSVDDEIEKIDKVIEKSEQLKHGLMQKLFTRGIGHTEFKQTEIGEVPEGWDVQKVGDVIKTTSGATPLRSRADYYEQGEIAWLTSSEVRQGYIRQVQGKITEKALEETGVKLLPKNTVLVAMYGATAGQVGILQTESTTNQAICALWPNDKFVPEFVFYYLTHKSKDLVSAGGGGAQPNISQKIVKSIFLPLPPYSEQEKIANILTSVDKKIKTNKQLKDKLTQLKKGLMQALLSNKSNI